MGKTTLLKVKGFYRNRKALPPPVFGTAPKGIHFDKVSVSDRPPLNLMILMKREDKQNVHNIHKPNSTLYKTFLYNNKNIKYMKDFK